MFHLSTPLHATELPLQSQANENTESEHEPKQAHPINADHVLGIQEGRADSPESFSLSFILGIYAFESPTNHMKGFRRHEEPRVTPMQESLIQTILFTLQLIMQSEGTTYRVFKLEDDSFPG
jgi:hypothetical protein